jgi:hypothetical protein
MQEPSVYCSKLHIIVHHAFHQPSVYFFLLTFAAGNSCVKRMVSHCCSAHARGTHSCEGQKVAAAHVLLQRLWDLESFGCLVILYQAAQGTLCCAKCSTVEQQVRKLQAEASYRLNSLEHVAVDLLLAVSLLNSTPDL